MHLDVLWTNIKYSFVIFFMIRVKLRKMVFLQGHSPVFIIISVPGHFQKPRSTTSVLGESLLQTTVPLCTLVNPSVKTPEKDKFKIGQTGQRRAVSPNS
ncbi:hypothetical protein DMR_29010 [Solidesulfovibrio magneticus RS-1]|uniref:Uncharacterized protein n=1 Tax=Solidesulfovibrio magneticus (strain ATCC 700980 / DSM 13731 / RS-1) TaxID=573370 RepID=C4XHL8_SOLM1|nr:hypothetical protein DMR_29010 [Solidesulfovibrio magneticus RS-1]